MECESAIIVYGTLLAELAIAVVIYYEIEENRASAFLSEALGEAYRKRARIYDAFVKVSASTLRERAEAFCNSVLNDPELRQACHLQLVYFSKSHYMLRWSVFHRRLIVSWFPHVLVRLWLMLSPILEEPHMQRRWQREFMRSVLQSFKLMEKQGLKPMTIYSNDRATKIQISVEDLRDARSHLEKLLKPTLLSASG